MRFNEKLYLVREALSEIGPVDTASCNHIPFLWSEHNDLHLISRIQQKRWDVASKIWLLKACASILLTISTRGMFIQEKLRHL